VPEKNLRLNAISSHKALNKMKRLFMERENLLIETAIFTIARHI
jgi:hypothetical protein